MKSLLFDLDGVFYQGNQSIKGADEVFNWVRRQQIPYLFITNTTSRPRHSLIEKLAQLGIETTADHILTPPLACVRWLQQNLEGRNVALFVPEVTRSEFSAVTTSEDENQDVAAVVVGDLGEQWSFDRLNRAFRLLMQPSHPELIALGMSRYWLAEDGLRLDVAPFVTALSYASDSQPLVMGKPSKLFFQAAIDLLGVTPENCLMIGDDIRSDIAGAQSAGLHAALVKTGKFRPSDLDLDIVPDMVFDSIRDLPGWWENKRGA